MVMIITVPASHRYYEDQIRMHILRAVTRPPKQLFLFAAIITTNTNYSSTITTTSSKIESSVHPKEVYSDIRTL